MRTFWGASDVPQVLVALLSYLLRNILTSTDLLFWAIHPGVTTENRLTGIPHPHSSENLSQPGFQSFKSSAGSWEENSIGPVGYGAEGGVLLSGDHCGPLHGLVDGGQGRHSILWRSLPAPSENYTVALPSCSTDHA